jgi:hypothetical protein
VTSARHADAGSAVAAFLALAMLDHLLETTMP